MARPPRQVVQQLLDDPIVERLPTVRRLVRLRERFGDERLEAACGRAVHFGDPTYATDQARSGWWPRDGASGGGAPRTSANVYSQCE